MLLIFQAMDAAGKDGAIEHVMSGVNPQGCQVYSFKAPVAEELDHDFLWRTHERLPERGRIGIFNRSLLRGGAGRARAPGDPRGAAAAAAAASTKRIWKERYEDIRAFERYLARNGTSIRKFFLHVSKDEQKRRFLERLDEPDEELEVLAAATSRSASTGTTTWRPTRTRSATPRRRRRPGTSSPPTTSGSRAWWSPTPIVDALEKLDLRFPSIDEARRSRARPRPLVADERVAGARGAAGAAEPRYKEKGPRRFRVGPSFRELFPAVTYSPTRLPLQYHRR